MVVCYFVSDSPRNSRTTVAVCVLSMSVLALAAEGPTAQLQLQFIERAETDTVIHTGGAGPDNYGDGLVFRNPVFDLTNTTQLGYDQVLV